MLKALWKNHTRHRKTLETWKAVPGKLLCWSSENFSVGDPGELISYSHWLHRRRRFSSFSVHCKSFSESKIVFFSYKIQTQILYNCNWKCKCFYFVSGSNFKNTLLAPGCCSWWFKVYWNASKSNDHRKRTYSISSITYSLPLSPDLTLFRHLKHFSTENIFGHSQNFSMDQFAKAISLKSKI